MFSKKQPEPEPATPVVPQDSMEPGYNPHIIALITKHEGLRLETYNDQLGIPTIGVGHNLRASPLPDGWTSPITTEQAQELLTLDIEAVVNALDSALPWVIQIDIVRQSVLFDLGFNMGVADLLTFKTFLSLVSAGEYDKAADDLTNTLWAKQVPVRAAEDIMMLRSGNWPEGI